MVVGETWASVYACVCETRWMVFICIIYSSSYCLQSGIKNKPWELWYVTYIVDVRNVIFVNSNCLLRKTNIYIYLKNNIITLHRLSFYSHYVSQKKKDRWGLPQPASWILQSLSPWSGNACRSPRPPCIHSSSFWRISLHTKTRGLLTDKHLVHLFWLSSVKWKKTLQSIHFKWTTNLIGWWSHHCRMQTVSPSPWREAWMQHWWSHCSAPWDEPERRQDRGK